jgi:hypothetical protein
MVLNVTLLASSRAQPLRVNETPKDGVGPNVAPHSANLDRTVVLHLVINVKPNSTYQT